MRGLKIGIQLVQRVPQPIGAQILACLVKHTRNRPAAVVRMDCVFVRVVAEMKDDVEVVLEHVAVRRVVAARPVLAGCECEAQFAEQLVSRWSRSEMADRTFLAPHIELVEIITVRKQTAHFHVNRVCERGPRCCRTTRDNALHLSVGGYSPPDRNRLFSQAGGIGRIRRQPGPEHDPIRCRIARGDPERKWIGAKFGRGKKICSAEERNRQARLHGGPRMLQKAPAIVRRSLRLSMRHHTPRMYFLRW